MSDLPIPLVPAFVDLRDFAFMPLDVARLRDSDLAALSTPEECWSAVLLWCAAWHQVPCGSLPDDDRILSGFAGFGRVIKEWAKVKSGALRGFVKCADGRLYHPVIAEKALDGWWSKTLNAWGRDCDRIRKENKKRKENREEEIAIPSKPVRNSAPVPPESTQPSAGIPPEKPLKERDTVRDNSLVKTRDPDEKKIRFDQIRAALNIDPDDTTWTAINGWSEAWLARGADFSADVLATVLMMMAKKAKNWTPQSLSYFDKTIQDNFDARVRRAELPAPKSSLPPAEFNPELEKWRLRVDAFYSSGTWSPTWGPTPDELGCHAPASVRKARAA